jgi:agmatine/peptidylarginine deiminase
MIPVDLGTLLVNEYAKDARRYGDRLEAELKRHGFKLIRFPYQPADKPGRDSGIPSAVGVYINFLQIAGVVVCPVFGQTADDRALRLLDAVFPKSRIVPMDCRELAA